MPILYNPRQAVLITCRLDTNNDVVFTTWHTPTSHEPASYAVVLHRSQSERIIKSGVFAVNFMPADAKEILVKAMHHSADFHDKVSLIGAHAVECEKIDCFRLKEALGWMECEVTQSIDIGNYVLFIGRVLNSEMLRDSPRPFHVKGDEFTT